MKTKLFFRTIALFVFAFIGTMNINAKSDNNLVYNYEQKDGMMVAQTVYKQEGGSLSNYLKYNYKYDDQKRMVESETVKWNNIKNRWDDDMCIRYTYEGKTVTTEYYKWNGKKAQYVLVPEMTVTVDAPVM